MGARLRECSFKNTLIRNACFDRAEINGTNLREALDWSKYLKNWKPVSYRELGLGELQVPFILGESVPEPLISDDHLPPLSLFQDAPFAPEMIAIPPGKFLMGSPEYEVGRWKDGREGPQHEVTIAYSFAVGRYAVTFAEWDYFVKMSGYKHHASDEGWGRGDRPVINISWDDAKAYVNWLQGQTGYDYRLLSEAEWEYVARAGTTTPFWFGEEILTEVANYDGTFTYGTGKAGEYRRKTVPVKSFSPNPWGLYQVHGNVWEWCEDTFQENYQGAPNDGSAWIKNSGDKVSRRVLRGGSWSYSPDFLRSANRSRYSTSYRNYNFGFRITRTLRAPGT